MRRLCPAAALSVLLVLALGAPALRADAPPAGWQERHDSLVRRLRALEDREGAFGPAYRPIYHAMIPWYELWGGRDASPVDAFMVSPEDYASQLADALEHGRNFIAENASSQFPLVFERTLPGGRKLSANYWLSLPGGFPSAGGTFPLVIGLHGSGWLAHKISYLQGHGSPGRTFSVTPIDMAGPWRIDFLNAYLDELLKLLPVDPDRVYVGGHSLGGMATWEWALDNPERFAAISPMAAIGEPYRAVRLKDVPSWVIHGGMDDVVPRGFADEMVRALEEVGSPVRYTVIKGGPHNMPPDLDEGQVIDWYLRQTRSHLPAPADPRDALGLGKQGYSPWTQTTLPETQSWKTAPLDFSKRDRLRGATMPLFEKVHDIGELADSPVRTELDLKTQTAVLWLAAPRVLHAAERKDPALVTTRAVRVVRFYLRGTYKDALAHVEAIRPEAEAKGLRFSGTLWIQALSIWRDTPGAIGEYDVVLE